MKAYQLYKTIVFIFVFCVPVLTKAADNGKPVEEKYKAIVSAIVITDTVPIVSPEPVKEPTSKSPLTEIIKTVPKAKKQIKPIAVTPVVKPIIKPLVKPRIVRPIIKVN